MSRLEKELSKRREVGAYRSLKDHSQLVDFSSNNYLGLDRFETSSADATFHLERSGSRLLTGNSKSKEEVEDYLAGFYSAEASLVYGSGYLANLGLFSCLAQKGDYYVFDELCHASIRDGMRLSKADTFKFKHNDINDLQRILNKIEGKVYVVIEGIYSMDGDAGPLDAICKLKSHYNFDIIIDEAHSNGVVNDSGKGLVETFNCKEDVFARIITFGKAMGLHGAAVLGNKSLKEYQINFSRPFIYTTAPTESFFKQIKNRYEILISHLSEIKTLKKNCHYLMEEAKKYQLDLIGGDGAIFMIMQEGNMNAKQMADNFLNAGLDIRPILSPTVKAGSERLRVCMHAYNTREQIDLLIKTAIDGH